MAGPGTRFTPMRGSRGAALTVWALVPLIALGMLCWSGVEPFVRYQGDSADRRGKWYHKGGIACPPGLRPDRRNPGFDRISG